VQEKLLQFIWQHSLYQPTNLVTDEGEPITVVHPGRYNTNAGPDFLEAKVKVGDTVLVGHVELHINTSDWLKHGHQNDKAYHNIILHVVYNNDVPRVVPGIPVLELSKHIPVALLDKYASLVQSRNTILCHTQLGAVKDITKEAWLSRLLAERWEEKLVDWKELLDKSAGDWRNLLYWRMAYNFGFKVNAAPFLMLARSIPLNVLGKHGDNLLQIEALLFGQAGMLNAVFKDDYPAALQKEYTYLAKKYQLQPIEGHLWKFLRMRPANFPSIRIAQFAALVHKSLHLFSQIIEVHSAKEISPLLEVKASDYWRTHYRFDDEGLSRGTDKKLGRSSIQNIIINTIAPIQFLYAGRQGVDGKQEKALQLLDDIPAEQNNVLEQWEATGWKVQNAAQSQALLQLYNNYCTQKRCLECSIGHSIMRSGPQK
jgi:hypothetical protein